MNTRTPMVIAVLGFGAVIVLAFVMRKGVAIGVGPVIAIQTEAQRLFGPSCTIRRIPGDDPDGVEVRLTVPAGVGRDDAERTARALETFLAIALPEQRATWVRLWAVEPASCRIVLMDGGREAFLRTIPLETPSQAGRLRAELLTVPGVEAVSASILPSWLERRGLRFRARVSAGTTDAAAFAATLAAMLERPFRATLAAPAAPRVSAGAVAAGWEADGWNRPPDYLVVEVCRTPGGAAEGSRAVCTSCFKPRDPAAAACPSCGAGGGTVK